MDGDRKDGPKNCVIHDELDNPHGATAEVVDKDGDTAEISGF